MAILNMKAIFSYEHYLFITVKIAFIFMSLSAAQVYDFHIFPAV